METNFTLQVKKSGNTTDLFFVSNNEIVAYIREVVGGSFNADIKDQKFGSRSVATYISKSKDGYNIVEMIKAVDSATKSIIGTCLTSHGQCDVDGQKVIFDVLKMAAPGMYVGFGSYTKSQNAKIAKQLASATYSI